MQLKLNCYQLKTSAYSCWLVEVLGKLHGNHEENT
jgi:hypothetical protein